MKKNWINCQEYKNSKAKRKEPEYWTIWEIFCPWSQVHQSKPA
jgi:hypothetical protein